MRTQSNQSLVRRIAAVAVLLSTALASQTVRADEPAATSAPKKQQSLYGAYLAGDCWGEGRILGFIEVVGAFVAFETGPLAGAVAADGVGRMIGGECAGLTGLDDLVLAPTLGTIDSVRSVYASVTAPKQSSEPSRSVSSQSGQSSSASQPANSAKPAQ